MPDSRPTESRQAADPHQGPAAALPAASHDTGPVYGTSAPLLESPSGARRDSAPEPTSEPGCPCCGAAQAQAGFLGADYLACGVCGTARSRVPEGSYQEGYYFHDEQHDIRARRRSEMQLDHFSHLLGQLEGVQFRHPDDLRILEFGCSKGFFVQQLLRRGHDAYGVDVSGPACHSAARRGLGARCVQSNALDAVPEGIDLPFHLVAAFELLEHFDDPVEFLTGAARLVRPGGWILGTTPNADSWWRNRLGPRWHGHAIPQYHRTVIGHEGFRALAARAGLVQPITASVTERDGSRLQHRNRARSVAQSIGLDHVGVRAGIGAALAPHQLWLERATASYRRPDGDTLLFAARVPV